MSGSWARASECAAEPIGRGGRTLEGVEAEGPVGEARVALAAGDLASAVMLLRAVTVLGPAPEAHAMLGGLLYVVDDLSGARRELELAFRQWRDAGEPRQAAMVATHLADLHASGFGNFAAGQGWISRARRLLAPFGRCVEQGYVELSLVACAVDDVERLEEVTELALGLASEFGDANLEVRALADSGYALVVQGRTREGFARLDEAMAALSAGEVTDLTVAGKSYCALLSACDRTGQVARADEWTRVVAETLLDPMGGRPVVLHTHCRLVYGSVLCTAGRWGEGESALLDVLGPSGSAYLGHRADACARLASLRLLQGRLEEAAELLRPFEDRPNSCEPLARLHLLSGDHELAAAVARRGLHAVPGDRLRDGALRALLVEVELAGGDVDAAADHARALDNLAEMTDSHVLRSEAALANARVAAAALDPNRAHRGLEEAARHLDHERPLLSAVIALELAQTLADEGDTAGAIVQGRLAFDVFNRLGARLFADRTDALLRSLGSRSRAVSRRPAAAVSSLTPRERDVLALLRDGLTNTEIGSRLFISAKTAEHHVGRVLAKLGVRSRAEAAAVAATVLAND